MAATAEAKTWVGKPVERVEDAMLLTGKAQFSDHLATRAGTLHAAILRSPHAHARIKAIDVAKAKAAPGVLSVGAPGSLTEIPAGARRRVIVPLTAVASALPTFSSSMGRRARSPVMVIRKVG